MMDHMISEEDPRASSGRPDPAAGSVGQDASAIPRRNKGSARIFASLAVVLVSGGIALAAMPQQEAEETPVPVPTESTGPVTVSPHTMVGPAEEGGWHMPSLMALRLPAGVPGPFRKGHDAPSVLPAEAAQPEASPVETPARRWHLHAPPQLQWMFAPPPAPDPELLHGAAPARGDNRAGVYLTASSAGREAFLEEIFTALESVPNPALVIDVKGSYVYFHSIAPMATELDLLLPLYDLPAIVRQARARGIYTIGRFISLKDPSLAPRKPETQIRHPETGVSVGAVWVDGSVPETIEYNRQIMQDVVASGIDEVNLDYIRYPTEYAQSQIGLSGTEKAARIEPFIRMARDVIDAAGGHTKLGLSTYAILGWNYPVNLEPLGQDVVRFAPLVDIISPMAYPATFAEGAYYNPAKHPRSRMYYLVHRTLTGYAELLGPEHAQKLRPWIQGYGTTATNMRDQVDAVYDAGYCGYTVWSAGNYYDAFFTAMRTVAPPERCAS